MIILNSLQGKKVMVNPIHIILVKQQTENNYGDAHVEVYHSASKAPLIVKDSFADVQMMLQQFYKK
jgi:hypothetical protein